MTIRQTVAASIIFCLLLATGLFAAEPEQRQAVTPCCDEFVGTVVSVTPDPVEGWWVKCLTGETNVLVWEDIAHDITIGTTYRIIATRIGPMRYPSGDVNVYIGIYWEAIE